MAETLEQLLDAAEIGIRQKGYNAVSFRELAEGLGIKSASVHYYFRKKEDLGRALIARYSKRFFESLQEKTKTTSNTLDAFCQTYRAALTQSDTMCLCGVLGAETYGLPEPLSQDVTAFFQANIDWLENELPLHWGPVAHKAKARQIVATLQGAMMLSISLKDIGFFDQVVDALQKGDLHD